MYRQAVRAALSATMLLFCMGNGVPDDPPPPLQLTESQQKAAAAGEVSATLESTDSGGITVAIADIDATPAQVMAAVMDLEARVDETGSIRGLETYVNEPSPERVGALWRLVVFGSNINIHILYNVDRSQGWVRYSLDKSKENDIADSQGSYQVYEVDGKSRLIYRGFSDSGRYVPGWIKKWLATSALVEQLEGIKARAEASKAP